MSLWDYATSTYARPGVEAACLALQDEHGQCVPFLLWRLWALAEGRPVDEALLSQAAETAMVWDEAATTPLRAIRRKLKQRFPPVSDTARAALREELKASELRAERLLLDTLEALTPGPAPSHAGDERVQVLAQASAAWQAPLTAADLEPLAEAVS